MKTMPSESLRLIHVRLSDIENSSPPFLLQSLTSPPNALSCRTLPHYSPVFLPHCPATILHLGMGKLMKMSQKLNMAIRRRNQGTKPYLFIKANIFKVYLYKYSFSHSTQSKLLQYSIQGISIYEKQNTPFKQECLELLPPACGHSIYSSR